MPWGTGQTQKSWDNSQTQKSWGSGGGGGGCGSNRASPYGGAWGGQGGAMGGMKTMVQFIERSGLLPGGKFWSNDHNTLYITGLPQDTTTEDLYRIFAPFGAIAPKGAIAMTNQDGTCKGFGFVNYLEPGACEMAMETINAMSFPDGRWIKVQVKTPAVPKEEKEAEKKDENKES
mmetsp:Transcript_79347/g.192273  ORF Transcript_79347/g.192273 Transcript_79347/m.192273 type:complete len:175 (-) Transcript_79347:114-638(-)